MNAERLAQRLESFASALSRLRDALAEEETALKLDATIQRFEFTYELAWKAMKLALEASDIDVRNAKDTVSAAIEQGLIVDANLWSEMHRMRNLTVHTYDERLAREVFTFISDNAVAAFEQLIENCPKWVAGR